MTQLADGWQREGLGHLADLLDGHEGQTKLVGGAVRDSLAGLPVKDIDFATRLLPKEVIARLKAGGIKVVPTGLAHGTVTAVLPSGPVEITTLRRDVSTDGRHATIEYSDDWREDASRRDFTINALYANLATGTVDDYFGGVADLQAGRVRFIGDPVKRIAEDHLRILRFFRFSARFASTSLDAEGLSACAQRANDLMALSRERIADELLKLLGLADPSAVVAAMISHNIFVPVLPEIVPNGATMVAELVAREKAGSLAPEPLRRLAALLPTSPAIVDAVAARLRLSNKARKRLASVAARQASDAEQPFELAYWQGKDVAIDRLLLGSGQAALLARWTPPTFPITGKDIVARGVRPGPEVASILQAVEKQWVAAQFPPRHAIDAMLDAILPKQR